MTRWHRNAVEMRLRLGAWTQEPDRPDIWLADGRIPHELVGAPDADGFSDHWQLNPIVTEPTVLVEPEQ